MAVRASEEGFKRIKAAIAARGWAPHSNKWPALVVKENTPKIEHPDINPELERFSQSSWGRFAANRGVNAQAFQWCCTALGLNAEEVQATDDATPEMPDSSDFYVERPPLEILCDREVQQPGGLLRVRGPRHLGKTRLLSRILTMAQRRGERAVLLDIGTADRGNLGNLTCFLQWFCREVGIPLGVEPTAIEAAWDKEDGPKTNCNNFWRDRFLKPSDRPLVVALDNVDSLFAQEWAADFFVLLRSWFDKARTRPLWGKLRLILSYSTEVYIKLDINQSPFNVGHEARLQDFTVEQATAWANALGLGLDSSQVAMLMAATGGHLYLLNLAWREVQTGTAIADLVKLAPTLQGVYRSHLCDLSILAKRAQLGAAIAQMVVSPGPVQLELEEMRSLERLGLGRFEGNGITWRCAIYRDFFAAHPIR